MHAVEAHGRTWYSVLLRWVQGPPPGATPPEKDGPSELPSICPVCGITILVHRISFGCGSIAPALAVSIASLRLHPRIVTDLLAPRLMSYLVASLRSAQCGETPGGHARKCHKHRLAPPLWLSFPSGILQLLLFSTSPFLVPILISVRYRLSNPISICATILPFPDCPIVD